MLDLHWVTWSFYVPRGKYACVIWWHGLSTKSGDSCVHKMCSIYRQFIFILLWEGFYVKRPQYHGISTIFSPSITLNLRNINIPDIYLAELQLNKSNNSDIETSFLHLNINVISNNIYTNLCNKRDDFGFPIVNFPWLSGDVPRLQLYDIYISQLVSIC